MYLSIYLSMSLSVCLSVCLSICKLENEAILRDFLSCWPWQHQKRSRSARLPLFFNLTTSKTKQFCETSSIFGVVNIKNNAILRDSLQTWKVECKANGLVPMRFFHSTCLKYIEVLRLQRKSDARSYEVLHLSPKSSSQNRRSDAPKCNPSQEISARTS